MVKRLLGAGMSPVPPYGGLAASGHPRVRHRAYVPHVTKSAKALFHQNFVKAHINKMPGATPKQRMVQVNAEYRKHVGH